MSEPCVPRRHGQLEEWQRAVDGQRGSGVVEQRLRVEEQCRAPAFEGGVEQIDRIGRVRGIDHVEPRNVAGQALEALGMEWAEPPSVSAGGCHHNDRAIPLAGRPPMHGRQFGGDLIEGQRQEIGELQEGDRPSAGKRPPDRLADDRRLRKGRVGDAGAKLGREPACDPEDIAFRIGDVLAKQGDTRVVAQMPTQDAGDGRPHQQRLARAALQGLRHARRDRSLGVERRHGIGASRLRGSGGGLHERLDLGVDAFEPRIVLQQDLPQPGNRIARRETRHVGLGSVSLLVVGVRVVRDPFDVHQNDRRSTHPTHPANHVAEKPAAGQRVTSVDRLDSNAHEVGRIAIRQREEGLAARRCGYGKRVVFDQEKDRKLVAHRLCDRLHDLALLRRAVTQAAQHDRPSLALPDFGSDADGLQRVVADRAAQAENVAGTPTHVGAHLAPLGRRCCAAKQVVEERFQRHSAGDHQRLVAVMGVEPIRWPEMRGHRGDGLMPGARHMERGESPVDEPLFERVDLARQRHHPVQFDL